MKTKTKTKAKIKTKTGKEDVTPVPEALDRFMTTFLGYGNRDAEYLFVGMEEGKSGSRKETADRIALWNLIDKEKCETKLLGGDTYHRELGRNPNYAKLFKLYHDEVRLIGEQRTWDGLAMLYAILENRITLPRLLRHCETEGNDVWLGEKSKTCMIEMFPLPCRNTKEDAWMYRKWAEENRDFYYLYGRELYKGFLMHKRLQLLSDFVANCNRTHTIVFAGTTYKAYWQMIVSQLGKVAVEFEEKETTQGCKFSTYIDTNSGRIYLIMHQPSYLTRKQNDLSLDRYVKDIAKEIMKLRAKKS